MVKTLRILFLLVAFIMIVACTAETQSNHSSVSASTPKTYNNSSSTNSNCHPSYSGCLKADASDYDCRGGRGNGPFYTSTVQVAGPDVFDLDRDNDGLGCE